MIWDSADEPPRRTVTLRRGLNIVWSPEGSGDLGHGAGKTLLCRLIRYALGEGTFANDDVRDRIRSKLHNSLVGADVAVGADRWAVVRSLGHAGIHKASRTVSVETLLAGDAGEGFDTYVQALQSAVVRPDEVALLPNAEGVNPWLYALACCSRDQESRASGILNWRHQDSDAHSPVRDRDASGEIRLQALRVFLGALSADERVTRDDRDADNAGRAADERRAQGLEFGIERDRVQIAELLQLPLAEVRGDVLARARILARVKEILGEADPDESDPELLKWSARLNDLAGEKAALSVRVEHGERRLGQLDASRSQIESALISADSAVLESKFPRCPYTNTPLDVAKVEGCPFAALPDEEEATTRRGELLGALEKIKREFADTEDAHLDWVRRLAVAVAESKSLQESVQDRRLAQEAWRQRRNGAWGISALVDRFVRCQAELDAVRVGLARAKATDEAYAETLRLAREQQRATVGAVEEWFDRVINHLVGGDSRGTLSLDGKGLHANVIAEGDRSTVAINSLKVAAFDIAVMAASVCGRGSLPGFLIHDSPREADLSVNIYERLFDLVLALEEEVAGDAPFQYIVTTTTPPPKRLQQKPWLVAELSGMDPQNRLLRRSL